MTERGIKLGGVDRSLAALRADGCSGQMGMCGRHPIFGGGELSMILCIEVKRRD